MKKDLCMLVYVYGEQYQCYIPLYIYTILKAYPNYVPIIISDLPIKSHVKIQLKMLRQIGDFKIRENCAPAFGLKGQRAMSARWIIDDDELCGFRSCYVGDVDMLIVRESPSLFEQHMTHCDVLDLPYSNLVRSFERNHSLKSCFLTNGIPGLIVSLINYRYTDRQLTGLHFYQTEKYLDKLRPIIPLCIKRLQDKSFRSVWRTRHHSNCFNNENFLYDMMVDAGIGVPPVVKDYGPHLLDYRNFNQVGFRPHHGIHLGVFRGGKVLDSNRRMLLLDFYKDYYRKFCEMTENDSLYNEISRHFSPYIKRILDNMHNFYKQYS